MNRIKKYMLPAATLAVMALTTGCRDTSAFDFEPPMPAEETPDQPGDDTPETTGFDELYRPQIHFTPARNWMNDPNGMVYLDGVYHLYYQANPSGNDWGNLSWGHATSTDLIHWQHQPVALSPDNLGMIFSGSAVIDKNNTAGFGANALVAIYTSADKFQQQSIAYSLDKGQTFTKYEGNPVIPNDNTDFRDPKVFWHEESQQWIMSLALGWKYGIDFWGSRDLKQWTRLSTFSYPAAARCNKGQWECPDLIRMQHNGRDKWVLLVSTNPGGPVGGSGTFYFIGDFDGKEFKADDLRYPLWLDYGADNYAGVTWSNTPGRHILIGWMNNWNYCGIVPASPYRSACTLPRELKLIEHDGSLLVAGTVVPELESIAGDWQPAAGDFPDGQAYHLQVKADLGTVTTMSLANKAGEHFDFTVDGPQRKLLVKRNAATGRVDFASNFSLPMIQSPLNTTGSEVTLDIYIDHSSVEIITADGSMSQTNIVFPKSVYNSFTADKAVDAKVRPLQRIW